MQAKTKHNNPCLEKALDDEPVFVILARDPAARAAIASWCQERQRLGLNKPGDVQIVEAAADANMLEAWGRAYARERDPERTVDMGAGVAAGTAAVVDTDGGAT